MMLRVRRYARMKRIALILTLLVLLSSCAGTRKCNGQRGTRVPMGVM
jgi:PBP1b-binding outer membrane lipoprotein LpoB